MALDPDRAPDNRLWKAAIDLSAGDGFERRVLNSVDRKRRLSMRRRFIGWALAAAVAIALPMVLRSPTPLPDTSIAEETFEEEAAVILLGWDIEGDDGILNSLDASFENNSEGGRI